MIHAPRLPHIIDMHAVRDLEAQQIRHQKLIDAMPRCQGHTLGALPETCVPCGHDRAWVRLNTQIIAILRPDVAEFDRRAS
jgi:hypothetical protein